MSFSVHRRGLLPTNETSGKRVISSKSQFMVLNWKKVVCSLCVSFLSGGRMEQDVGPDWIGVVLWIGVLAAVKSNALVSCGKKC